LADNDDLLDAIAQNLGQPLRARTDAGEVEQHDLQRQVEAAKFVIGQRASANASRSPWLSMRFTRQQSPGAIG
jgi:hypothetical protein